MRKFLNQPVALKHIVIGALAAVACALVVLVVFRNDVRTAWRYVVNYDVRELKVRAKMQIDKMKFDLYALAEPNPSNFPEFNMYIAPADLRELDVYVKAVGPEGSLQDKIEKKKKWYPATFMSDGKSYSARARIRGNQATHWINAKKSWRIKFKKDNLFNRRRSIHLIIINDKYLEVEQASYELARRRGLLVPDSGFATLRLNNVDMGLYFWTEHFDKTQLERREMPEGEVFAGDDVHLDKIAREERSTGRLLTENGLHPGNYKNLVHKKGEVAAQAQKRWSDFLSLLRTRDPLKIDAEIGNYLDVRKFGTWMAMFHVFGTTHGQSADNASWFYDPLTALFEPILWDISIGPTNGMDLERDFYNPLVQAIMMSPKVRDVRNRALYKLVTDGRQEVVSAMRDTYRKIEPYLYRGADSEDQNITTRGHLTLQNLQYTNENRIRLLETNMTAAEEWLSLQRVFGNVTFQNAAGGGGTLSVEMLAQGVSAIDLERISIEPNVAFVGKPTNLRFELESSLGARVPLQAVRSEFNTDRWTFDFDDARMYLPRFGNFDKDGSNDELWTLKAFFEGPPDLFAETGALPALVTPVLRNSVTGNLIHEEFVRMARVSTDMPTGLMFTETKDSGISAENAKAPRVDTGQGPETVTRFLRETNLPFTIDDKRLVLEKGEYDVYQNVIVPRGYTMILEAGVIWNMAPNVNFLSRDKIELRGTEADPIVIRRLDPGSAWGSFGVVSAVGESIVNHATIRGGGAGTRTFVNGIFFTGQLNFFHSNVSIRNSRILDSDGEDGLNIKKAHFTIDNTIFSNNQGDAFDGDWVTGSVTSSRFTTNGNDGLDFSGAKVTLRDIVFSGMGDKAISVGEQSKVDIVNCLIEKSIFGITSKDLSIVRVYGSVVYNNRYGLAAYRKKPLFGGGQVEFNGGLLWKNQEPYFIDSVSDVTLTGTGVDTEPTHGRVEAQGLRIGPIDKLYRFDPNGYPVPISDGGLPATFRAGPKTSGSSVSGTSLPDLSEYPIGMIKPLSAM